MSVSEPSELSYAVSLARELIRCPSVTPKEAGALSLLQDELTQMGFSCERLVFGEADAAIDNLFARIGTDSPHIAFAGHTDVVPTGELSSWQHDPFSGVIEDGRLFGRGAADMKGGVAAFVAAIKRFLEQGQLRGSVSLIITGDEEGDALNGTVKMVEWMRDNGHVPDFCIVGEPTNPNALGDMIKHGRRGSLTGKVQLFGRQGHVAYPHLAQSPVPALSAMMAVVNGCELDEGTADFDPSTAQIVDIHIPNPASNLIPEMVFFQFNIRFNTLHSTDSLKQMLTAHFDEVATQAGLRYDVSFSSNASPFVTPPGALTQMMSEVIARHTSKMPALSTTGGTSDARFICQLCDVAEFGLVGQTMHQINEHVETADIDRLEKIYHDILQEAGV